MFGRSSGITSILLILTLVTAFFVVALPAAPMVEAELMPVLVMEPVKMVLETELISLLSYTMNQEVTAPGARLVAKIAENGSQNIYDALYEMNQRYFASTDRDDDNYMITENTGDNFISVEEFTSEVQFVYIGNL